MKNIEKELIAAIETQLSLCDGTETPVICGMLADKEATEKLIELVAKKVVVQKIDIPTAIVQIENEFDPNSID